MKHSKEDLLKVCAFIGLPNYVDKEDLEINEIKNYLITKHARATIQDALLKDGAEISIDWIDWIVNKTPVYRVTIPNEYENPYEFEGSCLNMVFLDACVWWVNEKNKT